MRKQWEARLAWLLAACSGLMAMTLQAAEPLVTEGFVNAPVAEVWRIFTTAEGAGIMGVTHAEVDLRVGGSIRARYDAEGAAGNGQTIESEILAYDPERMLATRMRTAPAGLPSAAAQQAWSVIYFTRSGEDMTHVRIVGLGYGDDAQSQAVRRYAAEADRRALDLIAKRYWPQCALCKKEAEAEH